MTDRYNRFSSLLTTILLLVFVGAAHGSDTTDPTSWYTRYPAYPPYCSTPTEMATRTIPPLPVDDVRQGETRIVHVTAVIRHGARTPYSPNLNCWNGFWESTETGVWDCNLTTILAPPSPSHVREE